MLHKNTLGVKKVQGQSEAALQMGMCDQKLRYQLRPRSYLHIKNLFKGQLQWKNNLCSYGSLLIIVMHGINYFFIICLD